MKKYKIMDFDTAMTAILVSNHECSDFVKRENGVPVKLFNVSSKMWNEAVNGVWRKTRTRKSDRKHSNAMIVTRLINDYGRELVIRGDVIDLILVEIK